LSGVEYVFSGGKRGWKGDVPLVRFDLAKVNAWGLYAARTAQ
jgi:UDP-glucose 4-epimerase